MKKTILLTLLFAIVAYCEDINDIYNRANDNFIDRNKGLVFTDKVEPNWINSRSDFWYLRNLPNGKEFVVVLAERGEKREAFNHVSLAELLHAETGKPINANNLPFSKIEISDDLAEVSFSVGKKKYCFNNQTSLLKQEDVATDDSNNSANRKRHSGKHKPKYGGKISPDGNWEAFRRDHNLWFRNVETDQEFAATTDGKLLYDYASSVPGPHLITDADFLIGAEAVPTSMSGDWSPNSRYFVCHKVDLSKSGWLHMVENAPKDSPRPKLYSFIYPMGADENVPMCEPYVFCPAEKTAKKCEVDPISVLFYGYVPGVGWDGNSQTFTYIWKQRGYKTAKLVEVDAKTATSRALATETSDTTVNPTVMEMRKINDKEILWTSERAGWNQLYIINRDTLEIKLLTPAPFFTKEIFHVNQEERYAIVGGSCREPGDPYFRYIYKVDLDGKGITLLTPEQGNHQIDLSPNRKYFIDTLSTVENPPVITLKDVEGKSSIELEKADISRLADTGWKSPVPFKATAADGKTDIYCNIYFPKNIVAGKKYPIIEHVYTGPHSYYVRKHFSQWSWNEVYAELGFVLVRIDPRGTGCRSKAFRDYSYKNLGESGIDDRIAAIKQMAEKYPFMDIERVGIFGGSAGGYDSARALLIRPEFYDVAVSVSGNHDHRNDKAWWTEAWMSWPDEGQYPAQSNIAAAKNLKGNLLLIHGDMDTNVHISATLQLANALIEQNKDFDLIVATNSKHGCSELYYERKRWDYFTKHLYGITPPKEFNLGRRNNSSN